MTTLQKKIATAIATATLLVNSALPVFATTIEISGNGSDSDSEVDVEMGQTTTVVQSNEADVTNVVNVKADTGDNKAKDNTNSDVEIETGDATVDVNVENTLNSNSADIDCCPSGDVDVLVSGNGSDSDNDVWLDLNTETDVYQTNEADVKNLVWADAKTGDNEAEDNTGGSVSIKPTGDAKVTVNLSTWANANSATVGGGSPSGSLSARILGNGSDSENEIDLELASAVLLAQENEADVFNKVDAEAETGDNDADDNTGGETEIETGDATVDVSVDNMVNFNWADVECGCLLDDILAKVSGNGTDSENEIELELGQSTLAFQLNCADEPKGNSIMSVEPRDGDCELENFVDLEAESGDNDAEDNTGGVEGDDPSIDTGNAEANADIENSGNVNILGDASFPELDFEVDFGFNFALFWAWISGMSS